MLIAKHQDNCGKTIQKLIAGRKKRRNVHPMLINGKNNLPIRNIQYIFVEIYR